MALQLQTISYKEACAWVEEVHRHHDPPQGWLFGLAANDGERIIGVATVGRPLAKVYDEQQVAEVTRVACISPRDGGPKNGASFLLTAASRAVQTRGYRACMTAILHGAETGVSLKAAAWRFGWYSEGGDWGSDARPRETKHPTGPKEYWIPHWSDDPRDYKKGLCVPRLGVQTEAQGVTIIQPGLFGQTG